MHNQKIDYILTNTFKKDSFRGSQRSVIETILEKQHTLTLMPTGMGKSICFQIPALIFEGLTIVLSPLIALMKDQVDGLKKLGIDAEYINSSLSKSVRDERYAKLAQGAYKLLYVSPERFRKDDFTFALSKRKVSLLVVDEAHCASQWGNDFRPDYAHIGEFRELLGNPPLAAFTATATAEVQEDIIEKSGLKRDEITLFNEGICRENLHLSVSESFGELEKFESIHEYLKSEKGSAIVYFSLISSIDKFSAFLAEKRMRHLVYHGKLPAPKRREVQKRFVEGKNLLMIATNAFGMGVDKADIRAVVHAEVPDSVESYYQEIGRAGRDGKVSNCRLFYDESDLAIQMQFLEWRNPDKSFLKKSLKLLEQKGASLPSYTYEDLQSELVYKNKGDHRFSTVLSLLERFGYIEGTLELGTLQLTGEGDDSLFDEKWISEKLKKDQMRLYSMLSYVREKKCRKNYIHTYFASQAIQCETCDNCLERAKYEVRRA